MFIGCLRLWAFFVGAGIWDCSPQQPQDGEEVKKPRDLQRKPTAVGEDRFWSNVMPSFVRRKKEAAAVAAGKAGSNQQ